MGYVVPFMNGKGGTGKSVLARTYAVEAARAGALFSSPISTICSVPPNAGPIIARRMASSPKSGPRWRRRALPTTWRTA